MTQDDIVYFVLKGERSMKQRVELAINMEREACAALCFQIWNKWMNEKDTTPFPDAEDCAAAIRARERSNFPEQDPPQREWVGLTDEERKGLAWESDNGWHCVAITEAKLKDKNT
jgi:hypothetical protein